MEAHLQASVGCMRAHAAPNRCCTAPPPHPRNGVPTAPPRCAEGILLCDVGSGWEVKYANSAFTRLTGLARERAVGAALWSLFGLPAGGAMPADVHAAVRSRQPFTLACGLLATSGHSEPAALGQLSPFSSMDVEPPTSPSGNQGPFEAAGLFSATFTPATAPEFRPDEPAIAIPIAPPPGSLSGAGAGASSSNAEERLWFCTLQRPVGRQGSERSSPGSEGSTRGSVASGPAPPSAVGHLRPLNMAGVRLGPLLGVGASGRCAVRVQGRGLARAGEPRGRHLLASVLSMLLAALGATPRFAPLPRCAGRTAACGTAQTCA